MKFPKLVRVAKTKIVGSLKTDAVSEFGVATTIAIDNYCNYQEKSYQKTTSDKREVMIQAEAYFDGDITNNNVVIGGSVTVFNRKMKVASCDYGRNFDGSINYTKLGLM